MIVNNRVALAQRSGQVLGRGTILKSDHYSTALYAAAAAPEIDLCGTSSAALTSSGRTSKPSAAANSATAIRLAGAPNYRSNRVYPTLHGVGQPTIPGIRAVLHLIATASKYNHKPPPDILWINLREEPVLYINNRPFVLREQDHPLRNISAYSSIDTERLETMEARLKEDVITEASRFDGLFLVHDEWDNEGALPIWEAAGPEHVKTPREVFETLAADTRIGKLRYARVPITPERTPEYRDFDEILRLLRTSTPSTHVIFNCQLGRGRSTVAMVIAYLFTMWRGVAGEVTFLSQRHSKSSANLLSGMQSALQPAPKPHTGDPPRPDEDNAVLLLGENAQRKRGEYVATAMLLAALPQGIEAKQQADVAIDDCATLMNLREQVLEVLTLSENARISEEVLLYQKRAVRNLERYATLIAFNAYLADTAGRSSPPPFSEWISDRQEVASVLRWIRKSPADALAAATSAAPAPAAAFSETDAIVFRRAGNVLVTGTILKYDHFPTVRSDVANVDKRPTQIDGAPNLRRAAGAWSVWGLGQPTVDGIRGVIQRIAGGGGAKRHLLWISLREEPTLYINGRPFVLRHRRHPFRNIDMLQGIETTRLEDLEMRLKQDVVDEAARFHGNRILVHDETESGEIVPSWEKVASSDTVSTPREVFERLFAEYASTVSARYARVPITPERAPQATDYDALFTLLVDFPRSGTVIFNCQTGRGRSTTGMAVAVLTRSMTAAATEYGLSLSALPPTALNNNGVIDKVTSTNETVDTAIEFDAVLRLLRLLEDGQQTRRRVDTAIDAVAELENIRDAVATWRAKSETARDDEQRRAAYHRAVGLLERYVSLITYGGFLSWRRVQRATAASASTSVDTTKYSDWLKSRPEIFSAVLNELESAAAGTGPMFEHDLLKAPSLPTPPASTTVTPVVPHSGVDAAPTPAAVAAVAAASMHAPVTAPELADAEELTVRLARSGNVLVRNSILKSDHFPGCQKRGLEPRLVGAPNFRKVDGFRIYGVAIPTLDGMRNVLEYLRADPLSAAAAAASVLSPSRAPQPAVVEWFNLREEPVLYVNGRPFVVRGSDQPFSNLEHTGIAAQRVENMELRLQADALAEIQRYGGRLLLHDETEDGRVVPVWESVGTEAGGGVSSLQELVRQRALVVPAQAYEALKERGFRVKYHRVPITDEQAPTVDVFDELVGRLRKAQLGSHILFNCQMGRGRTSTGMTIACMYYYYFGNGYEDHAQTNTGTAQPSGSTVEYKVILRLVRVLDKGPEVRRVVDECIDRCSIMQNIRDAIRDYKVRSETAPLPKQRAAALERGLHYLKRYFFLIAFGEYLYEQKHKVDPAKQFEESFAAWMKMRPELYSILQSTTAIETHVEETE